MGEKLETQPSSLLLSTDRSDSNLEKSAQITVEFRNHSPNSTHLLYTKAESEPEQNTPTQKRKTADTLPGTSITTLKQQLGYNTILNASNKFEEIFGSESSKLICDNTNSLKLFSDAKMTSLLSTDRNSIESNSNDNSSSDISKSSSSSISPNITVSQGHEVGSSLVESASELLDKKKRQKLDEYYHIEEKQAKLLKVLAKHVYKPLLEENKQQRLCDNDDMMKVFYVVAELEQLASLVHEQVAMQIKTRVETEWSIKPYFGDILTFYYYYYR